MNPPATRTKDWPTTFTSAALVLGPLGLLAASLALPSVDERAAAFAQPNAYMIWVLAGTIGSGFWLFGYTGLAARIGNRFPILGTITTVLVFVGGTFATMDMGSELVKRQIGVSNLDHRFLSAFWDQLESAPGIVGPLQVGGLGSLIGVILLAVGISRAKLAPVWAAVGLVVGTFLGIAGFMISTYVLDAGNTLMLIAGVVIAGRLMSDDADDDGRPTEAEHSQSPLSVP